MLIFCEMDGNRKHGHF